MKSAFTLLLLGTLLQTVAQAGAVDPDSAYGVIYNRSTGDKLVSECAGESCNHIVITEISANRGRRMMGSLVKVVAQNFRANFKINARSEQNPLFIQDDVDQALNEIRDDGFTTRAIDGKLPLIAKIPVVALSAAAETIYSIELFAIGETAVGLTYVWQGPKEIGFLFASKKAEKAVNSMFGLGVSSVYKFSDLHYRALVDTLLN